MTAIPDTGTWYNGPLNTDSQQYDVLVSARGNIVTEENPKVDLISEAYETPDFFRGEDKKIFVAEPKPMGVIKPPKGHDRACLKVNLQTINGKGEGEFTEIERHVCLGMRYKGESEYLDIIHSGKLRSELLELTAGTETVEFVPLLSSSSGSYTAIEPGTEYPISGSDYPAGSAFNFGSVFRISAAIYNNSWIKNRKTDIEAELVMQNCGSLGIGDVTNKYGQTFKDQLLAFTYDNNAQRLMRSSDGVHWFDDMAFADN